jgi:hypothetical protein
MKKLSSGDYDTQGLSYDYDSITHYDKYARALDRNLPTIITIGGEREVGQRRSLSPLDIVRIKKMYRCNLNEADIQVSRG